MSKDKIGSFKVSEAVKRPVTPTSAAQMKKKGQEAEPEAPSAGFPHIEAIIEADTLNVSGLKERTAILEELSKKGDQRQKGLAKKALSAYGHVQDLLDFLWATKTQLGAPQEEPKKGGAASKATAKPAPKGAPPAKAAGGKSRK